MCEMTNWAKREVELACENERKNADEDGIGAAYGCACYESALKAFNCLCEDGHSGFSINVTKSILVRLIEGKPLTPIEDTEETWGTRAGSDQCIRMSSLFKKVDEEGNVTYSDVDRVYCYYLDNPDVSWQNGLTRKIIDEMFPITMPYMPASKPYKVYCEDFLTDPKNGDHDTIGVFYVITPSEETFGINRYFKDSESGFGWDEIDRDEYFKRKRIAKSLEEERNEQKED